MNILFVTSKKNWGGVTSWMVRTTNGLEARGHQVFIVAARRSLFMQKAPKNLRVFPWKFGFDYNPITIFYIIYLIKKLRVNIVITNIEKEIACGGVAAKLCKIPNIRRVGRHDDFNDAKAKIRFRHERLVTASIAPCDAIFNEAIEHSAWLKKYPITTIYNGKNRVDFSDDEIIRQRAQWNVDSQTIVIGITGRLENEKRVDMAIEAFTISVKNINANTRLIIVGSGKNESALKELALKLGIIDIVYFAGFTSNPMLAASAYDIALCVSDCEGFPNTIVEYMAQGRAVIATNAGGVNEIIIEGKNGFLINKGDVNALSEKIALLANDSALRKNLGTAAQKHIEEKFNETIMIDRLEIFLSNFLVV
ncbi:MAG: glycosyltransferase family 4 protein [Helicobacteraceae bacterium]|jgi:glycosyltransferase involved in cell wall biosynthesis|nr:glycosyltransferase family 4 protein [Helicobacteraceae bacterium]